MKNIRKIVCVLLAALLLVLTAAPAFAVTIDAPAKVYLDGKNTEGYADIWISDLSASSKITNIKSSDTKVVKPSSLNYSTWSYTNLDDDWEDEDSTEYSADIGCRAIKPGTATISFKVDGKSYSKKITVLGYVNPIKSLVISGFSKANLKSKFTKEDYLQQILKSNAKAGQIKVKAATGWKIKSISWSDGGANGDERSMNVKSGRSSMNLAIPAMKKTGKYYIDIEFYNTKTKTTKYVYVRFGKEM